MFRPGKDGFIASYESGGAVIKPGDIEPAEVKWARAGALMYGSGPISERLGSIAVPKVPELTEAEKQDSVVEESRDYYPDILLP